MSRMSRLLSRSGQVLWVVLLPVTLSGCFVTRLEAPENQQVRLLSKDEPARFRTEYKKFYLLCGFVPLWPKQPSEIIAQERLVEARAQTRDTVADGIITAMSMLLPIAIFPQHVVVEGNRLGDLIHDQKVRDGNAHEKLEATRKTLILGPTRTNPSPKTQP